MSARRRKPLDRRQCPNRCSPDSPLRRCRSRTAARFNSDRDSCRRAERRWNYWPQTLINTPVVTGIDRPVLDRTGLTGNFGFQLKFAPATNVNPDPDRPHLVTALTEQLGLKLEATQAPIDVLVIDRVDRPSEN